MNDPILERAVAALLPENETKSRPMLTMLAGGRNNRVYRIDGTDRPYLLKQYFRNPSDERDRLNAEDRFLRYAWEMGLRCIPEPLGLDREMGLGLYGFIEGHAVQSPGIDERCLQQAVQFYQRLSQGSPPDDMPNASEACFCIREHLDCVERRFSMLQSFEPDGGIDAEARRWIETELTPVWSRISANVQRYLTGLDIDFDRPLPESNRSISPSDFGFHNAILRPDGSVAFLDFEYAGWDDPAKTVSDFFCQIEVPVPAEYYDSFLDGILAIQTPPENESLRIRAILPVYRIKWCCIILNEFLPVGAARRRFSGGPNERDRKKRKQLEKAQCTLRRVCEEERNSWPISIP